MSAEQNTTMVSRAKRQINAFYWAGVFLWAGLVFGADSLGVLPQIGRSDAWNWAFFGAGLLAVPIMIVYAFSPDRPAPDGWTYIWIGAMLILGLGGLIKVGITFPLILLLMGVTLFVAALLRRREAA